MENEQKPKVTIALPEVTQVTSDRITITWNCEIEGTSEDSVSFEVFLKGEKADGSPFDRVAAPERNSCTLTGLKDETTYAMFVVAVYEGGDIAQSPDDDEGVTVTTLKKSTPPPVDWKKIAIIAGGCLAAIALIVLLVGLFKPKDVDKTPPPVADTTETASPTTDTPSVKTQPETPKEVKSIYSRAYDGFVNIHKEPSYSSENVGKFRNGPEGAILLEDQGEWTKIDMGGVVGYVASKYVQDTPTVAYTGTVDVNWLEGVWAASGYDRIEIFNNGVFRSFPTAQVGTWILQNNEIKFTLVYSEEEEEDEEEDQTVFTETLPIKQSPDALGEYRRQRFYSQQEIDQMIGGRGAYSKTGFRETGSNLLTMVESLSPKK